MKKKYENMDELDNLFDISNIENRGEIEKDNVESISKELAHVKCPNCGYMNFELTKKCTKCRYDLDFVNKNRSLIFFFPAFILIKVLCRSFFAQCVDSILEY